MGQGWSSGNSQPDFIPRLAVPMRLFDENTFRGYGPFRYDQPTHRFGKVERRKTPSSREPEPDCIKLQLRLGALLPRLQRNRQGYNFSGLRIEDSYCLWRMSPPAQFFQPLSHFNSIVLTSAILTVRTVDSQQGQQVASQLHRHLAGHSVHSTGRCIPWRERFIEEAATHYAIKLLSLF